MLQGFGHGALNRSRFNDSEAFTPCYSGVILLKVSSHINRAQEGLTERLDGHSQPYALQTYEGRASFLVNKHALFYTHAHTV